MGGSAFTQYWPEHEISSPPRATSYNMIKVIAHNRWGGREHTREDGAVHSPQETSNHDSCKLLASSKDASLRHLASRFLEPTCRVAQCRSTVARRPPSPVSQQLLNPKFRHVVAGQVCVQAGQECRENPTTVQQCSTQTTTKLPAFGCRKALWKVWVSHSPRHIAHDI